MAEYTIIPDDYQIPPAEQELIPIVSDTGQIGIDAVTGEQLFFSVGTQKIAGQSAIAIRLNLKEDQPLTVNLINTTTSEVEVGILGIPRYERQLLQYAIVNSYALNSREFVGNTRYTYSLDPAAYWQLEPTDEYQGSFGLRVRHLPSESAIQCYTYPPPSSFRYPDSSSGPAAYGAGGFSNGRMIAVLNSNRVIRYQPGRASIATLGIRSQPQAQGVVRFGIRNNYGDGYWLEIREGDQWFIIRQRDGEFLEAHRSEWNGDPLDGTQDLWVMRPDRVTMFKIEYSWYGAIGASIYAFVPFGAAGEQSGARWIRLHSIEWLNPDNAGDDFETPSLRNPMMRIFTESDALAGVSSPQFVSLYGSSAYIDGGDRGTRDFRSLELLNRGINNTPNKMLLGFLPADFIQNFDGEEIENQKLIYPLRLSVLSTVDARLDISRQTGRRIEQFREINTGYGLSRRVLGQSSLPTIAVSLEANREYLSGDFTALNVPNEGIKLTEDGLFHLYIVEKISNSRVRLNRRVGNSVSFPSSVKLAPFNCVAISDQGIPSPVTQGFVNFITQVGASRVGLWPSNGRPQSAYNSDEVAWGINATTFVRFNLQNAEIGESKTSASQADFDISGSNLRFGADNKPMIGHPLYLVFETHSGGSAIDPIWSWADNNGENFSQSITFQSLTNILVQEPNAEIYQTPNFKKSDKNSGLLYDTQGSQIMDSPESVASFFVRANTPNEFSLSGLFGDNATILSRSPIGERVAFFISAVSSSPGNISISFTWEESQ